MGCMICNYLSSKKTTKAMQRQILDDLAYDLAAKHPELIRRARRYERLLKGIRDMEAQQERDEGMKLLGTTLKEHGVELPPKRKC